MNICMPAYTFYEYDTRVKLYAEALARRGDSVDIIALRREDQSKFEIIKGVNVHRVQKRIRNERGQFIFIFRLLKFFFISAFLLTIKHIKQPYQIVHVHSVPDFEVFAALIPKFTGAKIILDIHDIVPELFLSKFDVKESSYHFKLLRYLEKISVVFSDHVIIANHIWHKTLTSRSVSNEKCTVILNYPDISIFTERSKRKEDGKFKIIYPGTLSWHQGLDVAVKAISLIKDKYPFVEFHIYGEGSEKDELQKLISDLNLSDHIFLNDHVPVEKIALVMTQYDLGVVPKRAVSFGNEAFSTKVLEFMALGIPIIISNTKIDTHYFNDSQVEFFQSEDENDLADSIKRMITDHELRKNLVQNSIKYITQNNWDVKKNVYFNLVDSLINH